MRYEEIVFIYAIGSGLLLIVSLIGWYKDHRLMLSYKRDAANWRNAWWLKGKQKR